MRQLLHTQYLKCFEEALESYRKRVFESNLLSSTQHTYVDCVRRLVRRTNTRDISTIKNLTDD